MDVIRLENLYKELAFFMNNAPIEDNCTDEENRLYSEMANLKNAIDDYNDSKKKSTSVDVHVTDKTTGYGQEIWKGKGVEVV